MDYSTITIALFQLNVALGILYIGLPNFRSRENFYDTAVVLINDYKYSETYRSEVRNARNNLMDSDSKFTHSHHYIRKTIVGLPSPHFDQLIGSEIFERQIQTQNPPNKWHHRWYKWFASNWDKCIVGLFSVLIPTGVLWAYFLYPSKTYPKFWEGLSIACGQIAVFVFFYLGREILKWNERRLYNALRYTTDEIRKEQATLDTQRTP